MLKSAFSFDRFARIIGIVIGFIIINFIFFNAQTIEAYDIPLESIQKAHAMVAIGYMLVVTIVLLMSAKNND